MKNSKRLLALAVAAACAAPLSAFATNGMDLEGYGPVATAMGGASMAYDNGTAAMMNNPATLGMMADGNRVDIALGELSPDVKASMPGASWSSSSTAFYMPAAGWAKKSGKFTWGFGAFAQGGMGTQYDNGGPGTAAVYQAISAAGGNTAMVSGWRERSEVGVMRLMAPLAYNVNNKLTVGGSLDYVHASMDLQMAMPGTSIGAMYTAGLVSGSLANAMMSGSFGTVYGGYFNFSDNSPYTGKTSAGGFAAKIGFTYVVNPTLSIGGVYQSETSLGDLSGNGSMSVATSGGAQTLSGSYKVKNFQWPATFGLGLSYKPNSKWMVAADVRQIQWASVMKNFQMSFTSSSGNLDATMPQNWKDQTVVEVGGAYAATDAWTVRAGVNLASNPIPDSTVNYLFPATVENSYSAGFGYAFSKASDVNFSLTLVPKVSVTNSSGAAPLTISHSQTNWQLMYSHRF